MKDSDFDLLCAGATPEEARRLGKLLTEWARGDEDTFPVQLALLTRSQWRVAAAIPKLVEAERKTLADLLAQARSDTRSTAQSVQDAARLHLTALQSEVTRQSTVVKDAAATIRLRFAEAEAVTNEIQRALHDGKAVWNQALDRFIEERQTLSQAVVRVSEQLDRERRLSGLLSMALAALLGFSLGAVVAHRIVARLPLVQLAPASRP